MKIKVLQAKKGGFCFGVRRAVEFATAAAQQHTPIYTLGPIIHNPAVVERLCAQGIYPVQTPQEVAQGATLVIRSHGVAEKVLQDCVQRGLTVCDATCPYVARIHRKAEACAQAGIPLVVIGEAAHPEVQGILGWCRGLGQVVNTPDEARALPKMQRACVLAQTTTAQAHLDALAAIVRTRVVEMELFESICHATQQRQEEAEWLSRRAQAMVVVGGRNSSNTRKLYQLCRAHCPNTWWIEQADELPDAAVLCRYETIGITSGASTPDWIIEEVFNKMSDIEVKVNQTETTQEQPVEQAAPITVEETVVAQEEAPAELSFEESVASTVRSIRPGQVLNGTVVQVSDTEVCVNIGYKADGLVPKADFIPEGATDVDLKATVNVGDVLEVQVKKVNDGDGNVLLSCRDLAAKKNWAKLMEEYEAEQTFTATCKQVVKGGVISSIYGIRAFIPASQMDIGYVKNLEQFIDQDVEVRIIEVDQRRRRVVASRKVLLEEAKKVADEALWGELKQHEGDLVKGVVRRLTDFGAFVDIGGVDGLVHITDMVWGRVRDPKDVLKVGDEITVLMMKVDAERKRVSLGLKQTKPKPWQIAPQKYIVGDVVQGKVVRIVTFGAFVELEPDIDGLVHISQVADHRIGSVEEVLKVGDIVDVKILDVNAAEKRISLSIRDAMLPMDEELEEELPPVNEDGDVIYSTDNMDQIKAYEGDDQ